VVVMTYCWWRRTGRVKNDGSMGSAHCCVSKGVNCSTNMT
jgi:hypothetical protein